MAYYSTGCRERARDPRTIRQKTRKSHRFGIDDRSVHARSGGWLIAETTPQRVIDLLRNRITIREAFPLGQSPVWEAVLRRGEALPSVRRRRAEEIPESIFPTPGMYMEGDEEEFQEKLAVLRRRVPDMAERSRYVSAAESRTVTFRMAPVYQSWQMTTASLQNSTCASRRKRQRERRNRST